ncbi:SMP-30/gluconolaconase/LRE domain protein [Salipaludibacillus keqinensis]|uniref:Regucalcin n=1 Tax=Salipaludibacillus keqinensis TaxID=2045207 RepID=A0A323TAB9_9BACI|nr:SMP-30/gluconolactonase/LRE family protein [Salipaludibacillus keqinensis]PYZ91980.1 SMP-30/gluconolaconase/LRE domain protein [Salipaludibacillus keqinensis]
MFKPELVLDAKATLGEGPFWDEINNKLIWVDIDGRTVNEYDPQSRVNNSYSMEQKVGAAVLKESEGMLLAMENGFYSYNPENDRLEAIYDPESHISTNRFNDGKCDPKGRFWAGTMVLEGEKGEGNLYRMDLDLSVHVVQTDVTVSNGMAWNIDKEKMYYIDTETKKIKSYDFDMETGEIANEQVVVTIPDGEGSPDGMTIDEEGMLWVAFFGGWKVTRFNPETGEELSVIPVPAAQVTSCTFGGEDLNELYITTARAGLSNEDLKEQPHAGGIFSVKLDVSGAPSYRFRG